MIYTLREEIHIIILLVIYGIYISSYYDVVTLSILGIKNKITKIIIETLLCIFQIYLSYLFIFKIQDGYIPIYFLLFILVGVLIYYFLRNKMIATYLILIMFIKKIFIQTTKEVKNIICPMYLQEVINTFIKRRKDKKKKDIISDN